jgi:hypothetical protein
MKRASSRRDTAGECESSVAVALNRQTNKRPVYIQVALRERMRHSAPVGACRPPITADRNGKENGWNRGDGLPPEAVVKHCDAALQRFTELAAALTEQPGVSLGRGFGKACLKLGKRTFIVHDENDKGIAFRVGQENACRIVHDFIGVAFWNPKQERQPKQSWIVCHGGDGETLVHLAAAAYEQALRDSPSVRSADDGQASLLEAA